MSKTPNNPQAFPLDTEYALQRGMTLSDWFAGQVISRALDSDLHDEQIAFYAYRLADAMLAERAEVKKP